MKLYTLVDNNNNIIAITEDIKLLERFCIQNKYIENSKNYSIVVYTKKKEIKSLMNLYIDKTLIEWNDDTIVRDIDTSILSNVYYDTKMYINDTIDKLYTLSELDFKKKDKAILEKALEILENNSTKKKIKKLASYKDLVVLYYTNDDYRNTLLELELGYNIAIMKDI